MTTLSNFRETVQPVGKKPPKRDKIIKINKRGAIIEAATTLFTTEGYEATTIADVARKAGVAVGTVYLYFSNKQELLVAVKDQWDFEFVQYTLQAELDHVPHQKRIRALIEVCFKACREHSNKVQLMGLSPQAVGEVYGAQPLGKSTSKMQQAIKNWMEAAIEDGVFRPLNPEVTAMLSFGMVSAALDQCFEAENGQHEQVYIDALVDAFERWVLQPQYLAEQQPA